MSDLLPPAFEPGIFLCFAMKHKNHPKICVRCFDMPDVIVVKDVENVVVGRTEGLIPWFSYKQYIFSFGPKRVSIRYAHNDKHIASFSLDGSIDVSVEYAERAMFKKEDNRFVVIIDKQTWFVFEFLDSGILVKEGNGSNLEYIGEVKF